MPSVDTLSTTFAALADPTRRAILARLALGDASVGELAEPFEISLPAVSRHLKVLEHARLIVREKDAQWRRCRLDPAPLKQAADWVEQYRDFWEERFDALDALLKQQTADTLEASHGKKRRRGKGGTGRRRQ
jgi:DNA-binding transcriptional ArsR family regulator